MICMKSRVEFQAIYNLLHVDLSERGESFYNPYLPGVVHQLEAAGTLVESNGAKCVFLDGYNNSDGTPMPLVMI
jgi:arginyl-tRNA synthetase